MYRHIFNPILISNSRSAKLYYLEYIGHQKSVNYQIKKIILKEVFAKNERGYTLTLKSIQW